MMMVTSRDLDMGEVCGAVAPTTNALSSARLRAVCGGAVDRDDATALFATDRVSDETLAVVDVEDVHLLVLADAGDIEQASIDRTRTFVMQLGVGDRGTMDLGFEQVQLHGAGFLWCG